MGTDMCVHCQVLPVISHVGDVDGFGMFKK